MSSFRWFFCSFFVIYNGLGFVVAWFWHGGPLNVGHYIVVDDDICRAVRRSCHFLLQMLFQFDNPACIVCWCGHCLLRTLVSKLHVWPIPHVTSILAVSILVTICQSRFSWSRTALSESLRVWLLRLGGVIPNQCFLYYMYSGYFAADVICTHRDSLDDCRNRLCCVSCAVLECAGLFISKFNRILFLVMRYQFFGHCIQVC